MLSPISILDDGSDEVINTLQCVGAPPPPPLPPPDLLTPAPPRRLLERRNSSDSVTSLNTMLSVEFSRHDNETEDGETHVLKPSEIAKGRKRKNVQKEEERGENDDDFVPLAPKPGAHMVLPFIPPKFPSLKGEGNSLIKPSEYLRSLGSRPATAGEMMERLSDDGASSSSGSSYGESGIDSPGSSLPSSGVSPPLPAPSHHLPVIREETAPPAPPPPPPPPAPPGPAGPPPPPPPPSHPPLKPTQSAPPSVTTESQNNNSKVISSLQTILPQRENFSQMTVLRL